MKAKALMDTLADTFEEAEAEKLGNTSKNV